MNCIILCGRLTKDPEGANVGEHRYAKFTLAVDRAGKEKQTDFIDIVTWDKTADVVQKYLVKGRQVLVKGELQINTYVAKDGTKRSRTDVRADKVEFIGNRENAPQNANDGVKRESMDELAPIDVSADDMPF